MVKKYVEQELELAKHIVFSANGIIDGVQFAYASVNHEFAAYVKVLRYDFKKINSI